MRLIRNNSLEKGRSLSAMYLTYLVILTNLIKVSLAADSNCFVSNCEQDEDPCAEQPDKNVAIYRETCKMGKGGRGRTGTVAICCRPNSEEGMLMTAYGAEPNEFPHMVHVQDNCGGTLYNRRFVITAAHCVTEMRMGNSGNSSYYYEEPIESERVFVRVGSNIKTVGEKLKAEEVFIHPFYSSLLKNMKSKEDKLRKDKPILYDLALIKLAKDVQISDKVKTLKIADVGFNPAKYSKRAVMLGWGTTDDLKTWFGTYYLQKVNSPIRSERECPIWETDPYPKHKDKLICVGGYVDDDYAPTAGPGDSGGPLICKDGYGRAILCGVASFAGNPSDCAKRIKNARCFPNAFTSIAYYNDWIVNITGPQDEADQYRPILNGEAANKPEEFPHAVYINSTDGTACGGTLITGDVVLTAAHCVLNEYGAYRVDLTVYAGLQALEKGRRNVQKFQVDLVHGPPKFRRRWDPWVEEDSALIISDRPHFYEDIILIQLDKPALETKYVSTAEWAVSPREMKDDAVEISWKISKSGNPFIQKRKFGLMSNDECQGRLDRVLPVRNLPLAASSICAVEEYSGGSACDRTTGGPFLCTSKDKRKTYVCGIQSFRFCSYAFPNVVTNIVKYADWIEDGLERFEKQDDFDQRYSNGFDYDYYGSNPPSGSSKANSGENKNTPVANNPSGASIPERKPSPSLLPVPATPSASSGRRRNQMEEEDEYDDDLDRFYPPRRRQRPQPRPFQSEPAAASEGKKRRPMGLGEFRDWLG